MIRVLGQGVIRVLVVDAHADSRRAVHHLLARESDIIVVAEVVSQVEALRAVRHKYPDVALVGILQPAGAAIPLIRALSVAPYSVPVVVATGSDLDAAARAALEAGAVGVIPAGTPDAAHVRAIRAAFAGDGYIPPDIARRLLSADRATGDGHDALTAAARLTRRELEIVRALTGYPSDNDAIAARIGIEPATVKGHLKRLMAKLQLHSRADVVAWAFRNHIVS